MKRSPGFAPALLLLAACLSAPARQPTVTSADELLRQAQAAFRKSNPTQAVAFASQAIAAEPKNPKTYFLRAQLYAARREHAKAVADYDEMLKLDPQVVPAWNARGMEHFKLGHIPESIADFDKFLTLAPAQEASHWQRGIAYYYAGRFADGRKQFELHQTVNPNDVENAVWHFLCVARAAGVEKARAALIPIEGDSRIPMMEVHALFAGKARPADVLAAARAGDPPAPQLEQRLFYAHLYLGLYYEATGDAKRAKEFIQLAAAKSASYDYMGDVARVHHELLQKAGAGKVK